VGPGPAPTAPPRRPSRRARALLVWFRANRRPLPWRTQRDPYRIWVAEVLLQQTRVRQAVPYYERFVARFPSVRSLAAATRSDVLKAWEGAGYYARARRLHDAARLLVRTNGGRVPRSSEALERLPGVGRYIARAIASLAFGEPVVALEANGLRVAARWTRVRGDPQNGRVRDRLAAVLTEELPSPDAGPFNEAVMELGETVCLPRAPRCPECPVAFVCRAYRELPDPSRVPRRAPRRPRPRVRGAVVVLTDRGRWLVQRRPEGGLLGGLWEFPGGKIEPGEDPGRAARRELREETHADVLGLTDLGVVHHGYSHFTVELHVFRGGPGSRRPVLGPTRRWVTPAELERLPVPGATQKIVRRLMGQGAPSRLTRSPVPPGARRSSGAGPEP
jgi:A/G-specific adenine glycosylase